LFGSDFPTFQPDTHLDALLSINEVAPGGVDIPDDVLTSIAYARPLSMLGLT
jgi:hypothetical protein